MAHCHPPRNGRDKMLGAGVVAVPAADADKGPGRQWLRASSEYTAVEALCNRHKDMFFR